MNQIYNSKNKSCSVTDLYQLRQEKSREMNMICHVDFGTDKISDSVSKCFIQGPARCEVVLLPITEQLVKLISTIIWKTSLKTVCLNAAETEFGIVYMCTKNKPIFRPLFFGLNDKKWTCSHLTNFCPFIRLDRLRTHLHQSSMYPYTIILVGISVTV